MKNAIFSLLCLLLVAASACHQEECEKGKALQDNLLRLGTSLDASQGEPNYLTDLCKWIKDFEVPYLRKSGADLEAVSKNLSSTLSGQFGIAQNIDELCDAYTLKGASSDVQIYVRDTINQIRNPFNRETARKLLESCN